MGQHVREQDSDYQCNVCGEWKNDTEFDDSGNGETCNDCEVL